MFDFLNLFLLQIAFMPVSTTTDFCGAFFTLPSEQRFSLMPKSSAFMDSLWCALGSCLLELIWFPSWIFSSWGWGWNQMSLASFFFPVSSAFYARSLGICWMNTNDSVMHCDKSWFLGGVDTKLTFYMVFNVVIWATSFTKKVCILWVLQSKQYEPVAEMTRLAKGMLLEDLNFSSTAHI